MNVNSDFQIDLTLQELNYLFDDLLTTIIKKLNTHIPTESPATNSSINKPIDPFKNKVALILEEFLISTFESMSQFLIIDGKPYDSIRPLLQLGDVEIMEPFDGEINKQLRDLLSNYESEIKDFTKLRKSLPSEASEKYESIVKSVDMEVSQMLNEIDDKNDNDDDINLVDDDLPNYQHLGHSYKKYINNLLKAKENLPSLREEFEKYNQTVDILESIYQKQQQESDL